MINYIKGEITELTPAAVVLETGGIGYYINIALTTYSELAEMKEAKLFIYEAIREDAFVLYGFMHQGERELFTLLISVSGVGANTARVIMSSYSADELQQIIATGNLVALTSIKGIGNKTGQRILVDLKDKIMKVGLSDGSKIVSGASLQLNPVRDEALAALQMLGFSVNPAQKAVDKVLKDSPDVDAGSLVRLSLKLL